MYQLGCGRHPTPTARAALPSFQRYRATKVCDGPQTGVPKPPWSSCVTVTSLQCRDSQYVGAEFNCRLYTTDWPVSHERLTKESGSIVSDRGRVSKPHAVRAHAFAPR